MRVEFCQSWNEQRKSWHMALTLAVTFFCVAVGLAHANEIKPLSLRLTPEDMTLCGLKASQQFLVLATYDDGVERDVTRQSDFTITDSRVAQVDRTGRVKALVNGETVLKARFEGLEEITTVRISGSEETRPFSFARDIGGTLTKRGCNNSDCHGSVKGKGGLKLSANALYPRDDYDWIIKGGTYQVLTIEPKGPRTPRINPEKPEESLLLTKPTMQVVHGGGQRFTVGSADYETILNWIRNGAPYGEEDSGESVRMVKIEVFPKQIVVDADGQHQLLVTGHLSNGCREDITLEVLYVSNNPEVVQVTSEGLVKAVKTGETAVMIRAAGHVASGRVGVIAKPLASYPEVEERNFVDGYVFGKLRKFNIIPSELSSDAEFLRRVCLDLTGTLPPSERVREFLGSKDPEKREKLIETLLDSPEYIDYWTFRFSDLFRVSHEQGSVKFSRMYWEWIRRSISENRPYSELARDRIAAQGFNGPTRHYWAASDIRPIQDTMAEQVRVFWGQRLDCAQCHNHPYETWSQEQYWGLAAFFGRVTQLGDLGGNGDPIIIDDPAGHGTFGQGAKVIHPRTKEEVQPAFLDGAVLPEEHRKDLRMKLAERMIAHPYFAEAAVNRIWGYFFGRGFVDPVDDFRSTNPPTHPDLLEALARDFREHGYDLKRLMWLIVRSRTYQLSGVPNETNDDDKINYSRAPARPLDAEVLLDAICQVTGVPEAFPGAGNGQNYAGDLPPGTRAINLLRPETPSLFLDVHGRPNRLTVPERKMEANLQQALHLLAGKTYTAKLSDPQGRLQQLLKSGRSDREIIEEFYLSALSRFPKARELEGLNRQMRRRQDRTKAFQDFLWGLLSSREFAYNH